MYFSVETLTLPEKHHYYSTVSTIENVERMILLTLKPHGQLDMHQRQITPP